ncbi:MAG: EutN/CcmL family microcompartment protein [Deltaproteobacteria bacterium]|nr:EutN/CcmL family microcompartment protein [Deltaproteobacteria bacterium]
MKLARVIGTVVATVHHPAYQGQTVLLCQQVDCEDQSTASAIVAVDRAQAGVGDLVLINSEGNGSRQMFGLDPKDKLPIIDVIVGIVDCAEESWR